MNWRNFKGDEEITRFLRFSIDPFGDGEMNLLTTNSFGFVGFFETVPDKVCTYVGVYVFTFLPSVVSLPAVAT